VSEASNAEQAVIDPRKLRDYALSPEHPVGRFKAVFFSSLGFSSSNWQVLDLELRRLASEGTAELGDRTPFGQKFVVREIISGPAARSAEVIAVWIILTGEAIPRLVTVYPGE
jgi:hypothetical protein